MIISRTPYRISFVGGGSDLKAFYSNHPGSVVSTTIDKYMYVTVTKRFDHTFRLSYTKTEIVDSISKIKHEIIRECIKKVNIEEGLEITTIGDIPSGTGMGSSSTLTVGLLNALHAYKGEFTSPERLAKEACEIEIEILKKPIGKQDQYAAAYGGLNHIKFNQDDSVFVNSIICSTHIKDQLSNNLLLFYTKIRKNNDRILQEQTKQSKSSHKQKILKNMVELSDKMRISLSQNTLTSFGTLLHDNWNLKKQMAAGISDHQIDNWYESANKSGAVGGKILGAGGRGFLLFYSDPINQSNIRQTMTNFGLTELNFNFENQGSKIVFIDN